jgi:hypothetical protein
VKGCDLSTTLLEKGLASLKGCIQGADHSSVLLKKEGKCERV